jgi:hypothetical protein
VPIGSRTDQFKLHIAVVASEQIERLKQQPKVFLSADPANIEHYLLIGQRILPIPACTSNILTMHRRGNTHNRNLYAKTSKLAMRLLRRNHDDVGRRQDFRDKPIYCALSGPATFK